MIAAEESVLSHSGPLLPDEVARDVRLELTITANIVEEVASLQSLLSSGVTYDAIIVRPSTEPMGRQTQELLVRLAADGTKVVALGHAATADQGCVLFEADARHAVISTVHALLPGEKLLILWPADGGVRRLQGLVRQGLRWRESQAPVEEGDYSSLPPGDLS